MAAIRRKQDDKNLDFLRELVSQNGNKYCLDCNQRGPTYINTTIGSFVCSKCSGMLRGLTPPHRVKSISMATFTPEEIEFIKVRGNDHCRRVWLGLYEGESVKYTDEQRVRDFMSEKYEKKQYYLESAPNNVHIVNGNSLQITKNKQKSVSATVTAPLIAISPISKNSVLNNNSTRVMSITPVQEINHKIARPVNNTASPLFNGISAAPVAPIPPAVPDFPVDFSTANIYNCAQNNNNTISNSVNDNLSRSTATKTPGFDTFNSSNSTANDRYAALADLDLVFRQQKTMGEAVMSKNPFQSTTNDVLANKNPFFNGGWSSDASISVNPFMPSSNESFVNPKNPFL